MEINCYRMAINCDYSDIVRQLVAVIIDTLVAQHPTPEDWVGARRGLHGRPRTARRLRRRCGCRTRCWPSS